MSGCSAVFPDRATRLNDCNRQGGEVVTLFGRNFGAPPLPLVLVLIGGQGCEVQDATESRIRCKLSPGRLVSNAIIIIQFNGMTGMRVFLI